MDWATADRAEDSRLQGILSDLPAYERRPEDIAAEVVRRGLTTVWDIVQFHPGYDYTDFVRVLVAEPVDGGVTFTPRHKIFSLMASVGQELLALGSNAEPVLILDEINRGDIANIFGELLYALEYRDEAVATPYTVEGRERHRQRSDDREGGVPVGSGSHRPILPGTLARGIPDRL